LGYRAHAQLAESYGRLADLGPAYARLRQVKSEEELDWLRVGAHLSDRGVAALAQELEPGLTERELGAIVERAYLPWGGTNHIHFFGVTPMVAPHCPVPAQFPSSRRLEAGDVVFTEVSASFWDYPGQVLRSFTVAADPTPLYRDLHAAAEAAFDAVAAVLRAGATPQQVVAAAGVIEDAGFTTDDDLVHGFGGGYLPPVIGSRSRPASPG
jgi:Xaa-Pro aminopeptidase